MNLLLGSLLLAGLCRLGATVNVPIMANFDNQRIARDWYPLLYIPIGRSIGQAFPPFRFLAQPNGNLKYSFRSPQNGGCTTQEVALTKVGQPGDYVTTAPSTVRFVETDYNTYFISYITLGANRGYTFLALTGAQPTVTPALEARFRAVASSLGITGEVLPSPLKATC